MPTVAPQNSATPQTDRSSPRRLPPILVMLVVALLTFLPLVRFGFVCWDDFDTIVRNPRMIPTATSLRLIWTRPYMGLYVPLTSTVWWIVGALSSSRSHQPNPHVFHALNVLLHLATSTIAFLFLNRLLKNRWAAAAGALVFAVHPLQVETVAWISGTKDLLCGLLVIVTLWRWLIFCERGFDRRDRRDYIVATACMVLACLAKPTAVVSPLLALALTWIVLRHSFLRAMRWLWVWFVLVVPCVIWTGMVQTPRLVRPPPLAMRPVVAADAIGFYLHKLVIPTGLAVDYGRTPQSVLGHSTAYWLTPLIILLLVAIWLTGSRILRGAMLLFLLPLVPVLGFVPFDFQYISTVADHYVYLPMLGIALAVAWLLTRISPRIAVTLASIMLVLLSTRSMAQVAVWRDTRSLFHQVLLVNPHSFSAYQNLAVDAYEKGQYQDAARLAQLAIDRKADDSAAYLSRAMALAKLGAVAGSIQAYRIGLQHCPDDASLLTNLAAALAERGELDQACRLARRAVDVEPQYALARLNLGTILAHSGRRAEAITQFRIAVDLSPTSARAHADLGFALAAAGQFDEAAEQLRAALQRQPNDSRVRQSLQQISRLSQPATGVSKSP